MKSRSKTPLDGFMGTTVVGERGQVVIPKELRDQLKMTPGTQLVVFRHGSGPLVMFPMTTMRAMMQKMTARFEKLESIMKG